MWGSRLPGAFDALFDSVGGQLPVAQQVELKLPDVFRAELVGRPMEVLRELPQSIDVGCYSSLGIVTTLEFVQHHLS